ncbi:hypothetical protein BCR44DRAFT_278794 [Catenaria anguillulae PL171]|uniref:Uncharacterized protein n=1 Tax=Catenaria anguillulae PL171 TaxID=765915 RepID=A0A1Y2HPR6_9FUNG|nr:hypothetical protein BCR44DRAFT_278794 [Catenaria anguillulae PL171]
MGELAHTAACKYLSKVNMSVDFACRAQLAGTLLGMPDANAPWYIPRERRECLGGTSCGHDFFLGLCEGDDGQCLVGGRVVRLTGTDRERVLRRTTARGWDSGVCWGILTTTTPTRVTKAITWMAGATWRSSRVHLELSPQIREPSIRVYVTMHRLPCAPLRT